MKCSGSKIDEIGVKEDSVNQGVQGTSWYWSVFPLRPYVAILAQSLLKLAQSFSIENRKKEGF